MTRTKLLSTAFSMTLLLASAAFAADEVNVGNGLTLNGNVLGLHGVDPTSMFGTGKPALGDAAFTATHEGVDYYFANQAARDRFEADPAGHLPQFGGFCAFGVMVGKKLDGDVRYADIVDGKLYLFVNAAIFEKYLEQKEEVIAGAYANWPEIRNTAISDL
jgi:YHS domain-containing protein